MAKRKKSSSSPDLEISDIDVDKVIDQLSQEFGEGIAFRSGTKLESLTKGVISTGILSLDKALGVWGLPIGRIIEVFGAEMSGKCLTKSSTLLTNLGLLTIEELYKELGYKASCRQRKEDISSKGLVVHTTNGNQNVDYLFWNGRRPVYKVTTKNGLQQSMTANHQVKTMAANGFLEWRACSELKPGDYVAVNRKEWNGGFDLCSPEEARFIGYLIADGCLTERHRIQFSNSNQDVVDDYIRCVDKIDPQIEIKHYHNKDSSSTTHIIYSGLFRNSIMEAYNLKYTKAAGKQVPLCIRKCTPGIWKEYLKAYFECEADINIKKSTIEISSASALLLEQTQLMLLGLGIVSKRFTKFNKKYGRDYHYLTISGYNFDLFGIKIGFVSKERLNKMKLCRTHSNYTKEDVIPNQMSLVKTLMRNMETDRKWSKIATDVLSKRANLTFNKLDRIFAYCRQRGINHPILDHWKSLENIKFDRVSEIKYEGKQAVFDIHQPTYHTFTANGIVNHNSSLAMKAAGEAQKQGYVVVYVDLEHTLDLELARNSGMDIVDYCIIVQPEFGEQAMQYIERILRSKLKVFIIVDSVAALLPRVELETEFTAPTQLGRQAALMTEALRKLAGLISKSNGTLLFVNQTRQKIGGYFPGAQSTPGGNALKFYSSIRIKVGKEKSITNKEEIVGHTAKIKIEKNKLAAPFKEVSIDLFYGSGFCGIADVLKIAAANDIVNQSGSWYSYGGQQLGQGLYSTLKTLIDETSLYKEIRDKAVDIMNAKLVHPDLYCDRTIKIGDELWHSDIISERLPPEDVEEAEACE